MQIELIVLQPVMHIKISDLPCHRVEPAQSVIRTDPHLSLIILQDTIHDITGQTVFHGDMHETSRRRLVGPHPAQPPVGSYPQDPAGTIRCFTDVMDHVSRNRRGIFFFSRINRKFFIFHIQREQANAPGTDPESTSGIRQEGKQGRSHESSVPPGDLLIAFSCVFCQIIPDQACVIGSDPQHIVLCKTEIVDIPQALHVFGGDARNIYHRHKLFCNRIKPKQTIIACSNPQFPLIIPCNSTDMITGKSIRIMRIMPIDSKNIFPAIQTVQPTAIRSDPYPAMIIFIEGGHIIAAQTVLLFFPVTIMTKSYHSGIQYIQSSRPDPQQA